MAQLVRHLLSTTKDPNQDNSRDVLNWPRHRRRRHCTCAEDLLPTAVELVVAAPLNYADRITFDDLRARACATGDSRAQEAAADAFATRRNTPVHSHSRRILVPTAEQCLCRCASSRHVVEPGEVV